MKSVVRLALACSALLAVGSQAFAGQKAKADVVKAIDLTTITSSDGHYYGGNIEINESKKSMKVYLHTCPPFARCIVGGRTLLIDHVKISTTRCGATVYAAKNDKRIVDGMLVDISVIDYANDVCEARTAHGMPVMTLKTATVGSDVEVVKGYSTGSFRDVSNSHKPIDNIPPRKFCAQMTGVVINQDSGVCVFYRNSCERANLLSEGYEDTVSSNCESTRPPIQMCTAVAGQLINPRTLKCVSFTDGCQRASLIAQGFEPVTDNSICARPNQ
jgi:hypothetical protein